MNEVVYLLAILTFLVGFLGATLGSTGCSESSTGEGGIESISPSLLDDSETEIEVSDGVVAAEETVPKLEFDGTEEGNEFRRTFHSAPNTDEDVEGPVDDAIPEEVPDGEIAEPAGGEEPLDTSDEGAPPDAVSVYEPPPEWWGDPISAKPGEWAWIDFPDSRCADGSPTGLGVNLSPGATRALIYFEGAGAVGITLPVSEWSKPHCT